MLIKSSLLTLTRENLVLLMSLTWRTQLCKYLCTLNFCFVYKHEMSHFFFNSHLLILSSWSFHFHLVCAQSVPPPEETAVRRAEFQLRLKIATHTTDELKNIYLILLLGQFHEKLTFCHIRNSSSIANNSKCSKFM